MKDYKLYLFLSVSIIFAIGSIVLAFYGIKGWGWFLLASLLTFVYPSKMDNDD